MRSRPRGSKPPDVIDTNVVNLQLRVSYLQVHNFRALVDTDGDGVVVFSGHQDLLQGFAGALSTFGGFLDQNLLKSHDEDDEDIPQETGESVKRVCSESKSEREQSALQPAASLFYTLQLVRRSESAAP